MGSRAFFLIKPDGLERADEILDMVRASFDILAERRFEAVPGDRVAALYEEHRGKPFHPWLMSALRERPVRAFLLGGHLPCSCQDLHRDLAGLVGETNPRLAAPGTIRSLSGDDMERSMSEGRVVRNLVHRSRTQADTEREAAIFFFDHALDPSRVKPGPWALEAVSPLAAGKELAGIFLEERLADLLSGKGVIPRGSRLVEYAESGEGRLHVGYSDGHETVRRELQLPLAPGV